MIEESNEKILADFPKTKLILIFFIFWLILACVPMTMVFLGKYFAWASPSEVSIAGNIGETFGMVNSLFSTAALLFVIWSIKLQRQEVSLSQQEWRENTKSQQLQAELMKETSYLTAINHIYQHFDSSFGKDDTSGIHACIAEGHRRWAIRETLSNIDVSFNELIQTKINDEYIALKKALVNPSVDKQYLKNVSSQVSSLLMEKRLPLNIRSCLYNIYELLMHTHNGLNEQKSFNSFEAECTIFCSLSIESINES